MEKSLNQTPTRSLPDVNCSVKSAKSTRTTPAKKKKAPGQRLRQLSRLLPTCAALLQAFAAAKKSRSEGGRDGGNERARGETTQLTEEEGEEHPDKTERSLHVRDGR